MSIGIVQMIFVGQLTLAMRNGAESVQHPVKKKMLSKRHFKSEDGGFQLSGFRQFYRIFYREPLIALNFWQNPFGGVALKKAAAPREEDRKNIDFHSYSRGPAR